MSVSVCLCKHSGLTRCSAINNIYSSSSAYSIMVLTTCSRSLQGMNYDGEGNELAVFRLLLFPFLEHRCNIARFHRGSVDQDYWWGLKGWYHQVHCLLLDIALLNSTDTVTMMLMSSMKGWSGSSQSTGHLAVNSSLVNFSLYLNFNWNSQVSSYYFLPQLWSACLLLSAWESHGLSVFMCLVKAQNFLVGWGWAGVLFVIRASHVSPVLLS